MRPTILIAVLLLAGGCVWGIRPAKLPVATTPGGARVSVVLTGSKMTLAGELFAADSSGLLLHHQRLTRIPWARISFLDAMTLPDTYDLTAKDAATPAKQRRLALVSRFPQGLSGPLLAQVLATLRQDAVEELP